MSKPVIQVTTHPFGNCGDQPRRLLEQPGWQVRYNPFGRRLKLGEVAELTRDAHALVAGTEPYNRQTIEAAENLKIIARVGVGFDNIDLEACRDRGIVVAYTPDATIDAVAEMTVAQILALLRMTHMSDKSVRELAWNRYLGYLVREVRIGVLGVGRIGKRVVEILQAFQPDLYGCDLAPDIKFGKKNNMTWLDHDELFRTCDLVTVHVPLNRRNIGLIGERELGLIRPGGFLVNLSRGKVVNEDALSEAIRRGHLGGAAMDVFADEPYTGPLREFDNVVLTAHMGASAHGSRFLMELQAAEEVTRVLSGKPARNIVPDDESP